MPDPPPAARDPVVSGSMRALLKDVQELRVILLNPEALPNADDVVRLNVLLFQIEATIERLQQAGGAERHPLLASNLNEFRLDVRYAQKSLVNDPPDFLQVAIVPGACVYCHASPPR